MAPKALVVVESPAKARTIQKYLGKEFEVTASVGHVKDLPRSRMGVDVDQGFEPDYETIHGKGRILQEMRKKAQAVDVIYLAPDPDREGEAIAWHIASELKVPDGKVKRVLFNEVTKRAILKALEEPRPLNRHRFNSQQARRVLDRLVGYQISPLLWDKVRRNLSAGRVQSVAVRLVVEREQEIQAFQAEEYWSIEGQVRGPVPPSFQIKLVRIGDAKAALPDAEAAKAAKAAIEAGPLRVHEIRRKNVARRPVAPFTTSSLQQEAARRLRFSAKRTMGVAQRLYEGIELEGGESQGLITYMRTDSTRLSDDAIRDLRAYITETYGATYLPDGPTVYKSKGRAQDAHEAIRPTSMEMSPDRVADHLQADELKLYRLIWSRYVACQMKPALFDRTAIDIEADGGHLLRATGSVMTFQGFMAVYEESKGLDHKEEAVSDLPALEEGQVVTLERLDAHQHFTQPPPRFTEATIVKELEERGIGRPSTYASIISTIQDKSKYVEKRDARFHPTELGTIVNGLLVTSFPELLDVSFTAKMEDRLDEIENGQTDWRELLADFWGGFSQTLSVAREEMRNVKREETPTELSCPTDDAMLVIKFGKNGSFLACSNYPDCRFTSEFQRTDAGEIALLEDDRVGEDCLQCDGGALVYKSGRFGRFIGCSNYPECRHTQAISTGVGCPQCKGGDLIEKQSRRGKVFYSCATYPTCDYAQWDKPLARACPACGHGSLNQKVQRSGALGAIVCPSCGEQASGTSDA